MRTTLRVLFAVFLSPLWLPLAAFAAVVLAGVAILSILCVAATFAVEGRWKWVWIWEEC